MSKIRDFLADRFEQLKTDGSKANCMGQDVESMDRDELLALIGMLGEDAQRKRGDSARLYAGNAVRRHTQELMPESNHDHSTDSWLDAEGVRHTLTCGLSSFSRSRCQPSGCTCGARSDPRAAQWTKEEQEALSRRNSPPAELVNLNLKNALRGTS